MLKKYNKPNKNTLNNFSFKKSYGGSFFSFFEFDSAEEEEVNNETSTKNTEDDEG